MFFLSTIIFKVSINLPQIWHNYLYTVFNNAMLHSSQETTYNKNYSDVVWVKYICGKNQNILFKKCILQVKSP